MDGHPHIMLWNLNNNYANLWPVEVRFEHGTCVQCVSGLGLSPIMAILFDAEFSLLLSSSLLPWVHLSAASPVIVGVGKHVAFLLIVV